jgi:hypothetical protein
MTSAQQTKEAREYILNCSNFFNASQRTIDNYEDEYRALAVRYHSTELATREGLPGPVVVNRLSKAPFEMTTEADYNAHMFPSVANVLTFGAPFEDRSKTGFHDVDRVSHPSKHKFNREYSINIQQVLAKARDEARPNDSHPEEIARRVSKCYEYRDVVWQYMQEHRERTEALTEFVEELEVHNRNVLEDAEGAIEPWWKDLETLHKNRHDIVRRIPGEHVARMMECVDEYQPFLAWLRCLPEIKRATDVGRPLHEIAIAMVGGQGAQEKFVAPTPATVYIGYHSIVSASPVD